MVTTLFAIDLGRVSTRVGACSGIDLRSKLTFRGAFVNPTRHGASAFLLRSVQSCGLGLISGDEMGIQCLYLSRSQVFTLTLRPREVGGNARGG